MDLSTLGGLLAALLLPVGAIGWIVSHFLDNAKWWQALTPAVKSALVLVSSLIVGGAAYAVLHTVPGTVLDQLQPLYGVIYAIVTAWIAQYVQHQNLLARKDRKAIRKAQIDIASGAKG